MKLNINLIFTGVLFFGILLFSLNSCEKEEEDNTPDPIPNNDNNNNDDDDDEPCPSTIDYHDYTYLTVEIDSTCWLAENLKYLPEVIPATSGSETEPKYYVFGHANTSVEDAQATDSYTNYGVLYNWAAAKTACPDGWELPSDDDWSALTEFLGGENQAGGKLKSTGTDYWNTPNSGATNEVGFNARGGGNRATNGFFTQIKASGFWWSSTQSTTNKAYLRMMYSDRTLLGRLDDETRYGYSVRCIKK